MEESTSDVYKNLGGLRHVPGEKSQPEDEDEGISLPRGRGEGQRGWWHGRKSGGCRQGRAVKKGLKDLHGPLVMFSCCPRRVHHSQTAEAVLASRVFVHIGAVSSLGMFWGGWDQIEAGCIELHHSRALLRAVTVCIAAQPRAD